MKNLLYLILLSIALLPTGCSKDDDDEPEKTDTPAINGKWKYDSNIEGTCTDLYGTIIEIKDGEAVSLSVPNNPFGFKAGDKWFVNIRQTSSANNFSANGVTRSTDGIVLDPATKLNIIIQANGKEMINDYYESYSCNPKQKWVRTN